MSAPRELNHPDDFVILTVDVADSPIAELRLSEIYDVQTSTMNDDYLLILQGYVALQLKATFGLCDRFKFHLLNSPFIPLHCRANGDIVSLRKPAMERLIRQTLQRRLDTCSPVSASILIQFKTPGFKIPRRLHESPCIPPKIGGIACTRNFGGNQSMLDAERMVIGIVKDSSLHSDASHQTKFQDSNNDLLSTMSNAIGGTCSSLVSCNSIVRNIKSNQPEHLLDYKRGTRLNGVAYLNIEPGDGSGVNTELANNNVVVKRSYDPWVMNTTILCQLCRSVLMMYRPFDRGRRLPVET
ncbi:hypothetical protein MHU86_25391 [Fragilaria crotonensis]|nr:hypothetical protein MHU86_25391 [Fragilaria crotonensis]